MSIGPAPGTPAFDAVVHAVGKHQAVIEDHTKDQPATTGPQVQPDQVSINRDGVAQDPKLEKWSANRGHHDSIDNNWSKLDMVLESAPQSEKDLKAQIDDLQGQLDKLENQTRLDRHDVDVLVAQGKGPGDADYDKAHAKMEADAQ